MSITVRYAETDDDIIAIHRFLCVVAGPLLPGEINAKKSATEVWRVVTHDVALMAVRDGMLVGTFGIVNPEFWWGDIKFLTNRWLFVLPGSRALSPLIREGHAIAVGSGYELHVYDEQKGRIVIFNRNPLRDRARTIGVYATPAGEAQAPLP